MNTVNSKTSREKPNSLNPEYRILCFKNAKECFWFHFCTAKKPKDLKIFEPQNRAQISGGNAVTRDRL